MRGQGEEGGGGRMSQHVAGLWSDPSALPTQGAERAATADPGARKAPGAEALGKTISWNRPPTEDWAPI